VYAPGKFKHAYEMVADAKDEARRAEKEVGGLTSSLLLFIDSEQVKWQTLEI